jgi:ribose 1,5-bisphosphate isomerase
MLGELVWIEERNPNEVISTKELSQIPLCEIRNPSFDVTPPEYIDALITEEGIISPQTVFYLMQKIFGEFNIDELASYQTIKPTEDD